MAPKVPLDYETPRPKADGTEHAYSGCLLMVGVLVIVCAVLTWMLGWGYSRGARQNIQLRGALIAVVGVGAVAYAIWRRKRSR